MRACEGVDIYFSLVLAFFCLTVGVVGVFLISFLVLVSWLSLFSAFLTGVVSFFFFFLGLAGYLSGLRSLSNPVVIWAPLLCQSVSLVLSILSVLV